MFLLIGGGGGILGWLRLSNLVYYCPCGVSSLNDWTTDRRNYVASST